MTCTCYQIQYRKKSERVPKWHIKCTCRTRAEAEKFMDILSQVSNIYSALRVEPIDVKLTEKGEK